MRERDREERLHRRVQELLPWYANGTLDEGERRTVEEHAERCAGCREEIAADRRLGEALGQEEIAAPAPHPAQLARLMERLDAPSGAEEPAEPVRLLARLRALLGDTPAPVRWALAAQLALVVGVLGFAGLGGLSGRGSRPAAAAPASFRTLSSPDPETAAAAPDTVRLRVMFAEQTPERQIRELVLGLGGRIAGGPSPLGAYVVEVPAGRDALTVVLAHLRSRPEIELAEPVAGEPAQ
jgi:anti-sigma factor RsiW